MATYRNYAMKNNVSAKLYASLWVLSTTVQVEEWQGARFWTNFPCLLTLESFDWWKCIKREIVKLTAVSWDNLTIERKYFPCFKDDDANSQTTESFDFNPWDSISMYIPKEIFDRINDAIEDLYDHWNERTKAMSDWGLVLRLTPWNVRVWAVELAFAGWTITLADNSTCYVMIDWAWVLSYTTTGWDPKYTRVATVTTSWGAITNIQQWKMDMVWGELWKSIWIALDSPTDLDAQMTSSTSCKVTWTDPEDMKVVPAVTWTHTVLVMKNGSAPVSPEDWTAVTVETTRNQYQTDWYEVSWITAWSTYFRVFALSNSWFYSYWDAICPKFKTFTVTYAETSSPSWFSPEYSDDAEGLTPWSSKFDEFFWMKPVLLNTSGTETGELNPSNFWLKTDWTTANISSWDNVMIKFPIRWVKMSKSWSTVTLSITEDPNKTGYTYYAHSRGTHSSPTKKNQFYLWAFLWYNNSNVLKSRSWKTPTGNVTQGNFITYARANDWNSWTSWYDIMWFEQWSYVNCLYMMKYWNPDSQTMVWRWFVDWNSAATTTGSTITKWMTRWETTGKSSCKLFWLEDWWGNLYQWIGWFCTNWSNVVYTALQWFTGNITTSWNYSSTGVTMTAASPYYISAEASTDRWKFIPTATNWSASTYYCDYANVNASCLAYAGGGRAHGSAAGAFRLGANYSASNTNASLGSRLMFL